jgi:hypothetical protein
MKVTHQLKIEKNYLEHLLDGTKRAEIRFNDRDYQRGDILEFRDYSYADFTIHSFVVTHIHSGLGLQDGYVVLSIEKESHE